MRKLKLAIAATVLLVGLANAEECVRAGHDDMVAMSSDAIVWGPAPPGLPPGAQAVVLAGNPGAEGPFTIRAKMPDGYKVPPHWHAMAENVTVISGTIHVGMGDTMDTAKATTLKAGGFVMMPAEMHHYAFAEGETVLQIHGNGPFSITYVNSADDPRSKKSDDK